MTSENLETLKQDLDTVLPHFNNVNPFDGANPSAHDWIFPSTDDDKYDRLEKLIYKKRHFPLTICSGKNEIKFENEFILKDLLFRTSIAFDKYGQKPSKIQMHHSGKFVHLSFTY